MLREHVARWSQDPDAYNELPGDKIAMVQNLMRKGELVPQVS